MGRCWERNSNLRIVEGFVCCLAADTERETYITLCFFPLQGCKVFFFFFFFRIFNAKAKWWSCADVGVVCNAWIHTPFVQASNPVLKWIFRHWWLVHVHQVWLWPRYGCGPQILYTWSAMKTFKPNH